jgi:hypothetical protein
VQFFRKPSVLGIFVVAVVDYSTMFPVDRSYMQMSYSAVTDDLQMQSYLLKKKSLLSLDSIKMVFFWFFCCSALLQYSFEIYSEEFVYVCIIFI